MEYKVVSARNGAALSDQVNELIKEGWELHGGLVVAHAGEYGLFFREMVKVARLSPYPYSPQDPIDWLDDTRKRLVGRDKQA